MRPAARLALLVVPLLVACAPPLECHRSSGDVWCEVSGWQRKSPTAHRICRALGGHVEGMVNELGQPIGDEHCGAEVWIPRRTLHGALIGLTLLLVVLRVRRRR